MKTQITKLENQVLLEIQKFTSERFGSDEGNWAYMNEITDFIDVKQLRALISTLSKKGVLYYVGDEDCLEDSYLVIQENYYKETGNFTRAGSPEIEFINLEVK